MLVTPIGSIEIRIDGTLVPYDYYEIPTDKTCNELDGRYAIKISYHPDGSDHRISCFIRDYIASSQDGIETGERLELYSFYQSSVKLSIGMEGDTGYLSDGSRDSEYDYDTDYLTNGVQYNVLPNTKTTYYVFGIAWINKVNANNDVQTWFGADPTMYTFRHSQ